MLTRRLAALVEAGLLERRRYSERPPRDEYVLTERGRDFKPVLIALVAFGKKHFAAPGRAPCRSRFAGVFSPPPADAAPRREGSARMSTLAAEPAGRASTRRRADAARRPRPAARR